MLLVTCRLREIDADVQADNERVQQKQAAERGGRQSDGGGGGDIEAKHGRRDGPEGGRGVERAARGSRRTTKAPANDGQTSRRKDAKVADQDDGASGIARCLFTTHTCAFLT